MEVDIDERLQNAFKEPRLQLHLVHGAYPSLQVGVHPFAEAEKRLLVPDRCAWLVPWMN
jgi:hypothetical protein